MLLFVVSMCIAGIATARPAFTKKKLSNYPNAVCVDGSPAVFYSSINTGNADAPWLIWLDGPSNPNYTSDPFSQDTPSWPETAVFTYGPFYDANFASYSMAVLMYCSNDFFLGEVAPFRGRAILDAFLNEIKPQLSAISTPKLILGGATSGGLAVVSNIDLFEAAFGTDLMAKSSLLLDSPFYTPTVLPTPGLVSITATSSSPACALNETYVVFADHASDLIPCCLDYLCASSLLPKSMPVLLLQSLSYSTGVSDALLVSTQRTGEYSASQVYNLSLTSTWDGALVSTALRQAGNDRSKTGFIAYSCIAGPIMSPFGNSKCLRNQYRDSAATYITATNLTVTANLGCVDVDQSVALSLGDYRSESINTPETWSELAVRYQATVPAGPTREQSIQSLVSMWVSGITVRVEEICQGMNCNPSCSATNIYLGVDPYRHISSLAGIFLLCTCVLAVMGFLIAYCKPRTPSVAAAAAPLRPLNSSALSQAMANSRSLEAKGLTYWNKGVGTTPSLKHVSFSIPQGSLVGIIGGSGCGKSTLLELLAGRRDSGGWCGEISICGKSVTSEWLARNTGIVRQSLSPLVDQLTLSQNLEYAAMLRVRGSSEFIKERISFVLERLELAEFKHSITGTLSGGQRKRAEVALELLTQPDILFLDEPTSALDARTALNFMDWIAMVARSTGSSIILSIHQPREEIWSLFSQIILLEKGFLVYSGPPFEVANASALVNPADLAVELAGNRRGDMIESSNEWYKTTLEIDEETIDNHPGTRLRCWLSKKRDQLLSTRAKLTVEEKKFRKKTKLVSMEESSELSSCGQSTPSLICQIRSFLLRLMAVHPPFKFSTLRSMVGLSLLSIVVALLLSMVFWSMDSDSVRTKALAFLVLVPAFLSNSFVVSYVCEDIPIYFIERSNFYVTPIGFYIHHILHLTIYIIIPFTVFPLVEYFLLWGRVLNEFSYPMFVQMVGFSQICFVAFLSLFVFSCFFLKGTQSNAMIMNSSLESLFALFSGFLAPLPSLTLAPVLWLSYMSPALWGYVGVAYSIADRQFPGDCGPSTMSTETTCYLSQSGNAMIYGLGFQDLDPVTAWIILVSWSVVFFFLSWLVLARPWHKGAVRLVPLKDSDALATLGEIALREQEIFQKTVQQYRTGTLSPSRRKISSNSILDEADQETN